MTAAIRPVKVRSLVAVAATLLTLIVFPGAKPASAAEISLAAYRNNVGITKDLNSGANFDYVGWSYSEVALLEAGIRGGQPITAAGMTFTWPNTSSGQPDNMAMDGQIIPLAAPGATKIGFLGSATNGPVTAPVKLHYTHVDELGQLVKTAVTHNVTLSDWTLNAGGAQAHSSNTVAADMLFRWPVNQALAQDEPFLFVTSIPIDTTKALDSIEFPRQNKMHLFGMVVQ